MYMNIINYIYKCFLGNFYLFEKSSPDDWWGGFDKEIELDGEHCLEVVYQMDGSDIEGFYISHRPISSNNGLVILSIPLDQGDSKQTFTQSMTFHTSDTLMFNAFTFPGLAGSIAIYSIGIQSGNCEDNLKQESYGGKIPFNDLYKFFMNNDNSHYQAKGNN